MFRCQGRSVGLALAMAMFGHVGFVLAFYLAARTLSPAGQIPALGAHFLLVPVGMAIIQVKMNDMKASATVSTSCSPISSAFGR